jgi:protein phosphatase 1L
VYDGHGGRAAVDYISDNLGKNIISRISQMEKGENQLEMAIRTGYLTTDEEFISQVLILFIAAS